MAAKHPQRPVERVVFPREVWILAAVAFFVAVGYGIVAPAIPGFARDFGVGRTLAALVVSMFALARLTTALGGGRLVDAFGARRVLGTGLIIVAVSSALAGAAQNYWQLLALRGVGGIGSAMFTISAASVLAATVDSSIRGRAMSVYSGGFLAGGISGPVIGGPLTDISLRLPFFFYAGTLAVAAVITFTMLPRVGGRRAAAVTPVDEPPADEAPAVTEGAREALRDRLFRAAVLANFSASWSMAVRTATIPLFVVEGLRHGASMTGIGLAVYAACNALALRPAGSFSDSRGRRAAMIAGALTTAVALGLLALPAGLAIFFVSMAVGGCGAALQVVGPSAVAGDMAGGRRGSVLATFQMAGDVGVVAGPLIVNFTVDHLGYSAAFILSALVASLAALFATLSRERPAPGRDPA